MRSRATALECLSPCVPPTDSLTTSYMTICPEKQEINETRHALLQFLFCAPLFLGLDGATENPLLIRLTDLLENPICLEIKTTSKVPI
jgi:hypothetical protein